MRQEDVELSFVCSKPDAEFRDDGTTLYCDECEHDVTVLSRMSPEEAAEFLRDANQRTERVCVAYDSSPNGEVLFVPARLRLQIAGAATLMAGAALVVASMTSALGHTASAPPSAPVHVLDRRAEPAPEPRAPMPTPDPNAAFDSFEYVGDVHAPLVLGGGANPLDIAELRAVQDARQARIHRPTRGKLVRRTKGVTQTVLRDVVEDLETLHPQDE